MFTKLKPVRDVHLHGRQYKKVIDWDAVLGSIFIGGMPSARRCNRSLRGRTRSRRH